MTSTTVPSTAEFVDDAGAIAAARTLFRDTFGTDPTVAGAAPGRVNLIGEHVDYNEGFVFPFALQRNTYMVASLRYDSTECQVVSAAYPDEVARFDTSDSPIPPGTKPKWIAYVKGMAAVYRRHKYNVPVAFRAAIVSAVPQGGGLSSSAALEMATAVALEAMMGLEVSEDERAKMGKECEHDFGGVPCGIMDQLISSKGITGNALLIDCRTLVATPVTLDHADAAIVIADSKIKHDLSGSEYPTRRKQCYAVAKAVCKLFPDKRITHLRDCTEDMIRQVANTNYLHKHDGVDDESINRALHVVREDERTLKAAEALKNGDLQVAGQLMHESHESLRELFEVSTKELDALVDIAMSVDGVYGSRMTGGGFGGCTVTLVRKDRVDDLVEQIHTRYPLVCNGVEAEVFATNAGCGARALTHLL